LTTAILVPAFLAWYRYFIATGWLLATLAPTNTIRSLPIQSLYEQVVAATPSAPLSPKVLGEWQTRAALSIELVPIARTAFCAAK
jgi:hypothetical protein